MNGDIEELKQRVAKLEERPTKFSSKIPPTKNASKIPEAALLIFIVTAACYLLIFWYENGWCSYFHINPAFIHPDLFTMLGSGIGGILVLALLFMAIALFFHHMQTEWGVIKWIVIILGTIAIAAIYIAIRNREDFTIAVSVVLWWLLVPLPHLSKSKQEHKCKYMDGLKEFTSKYKEVVTIPLSIGVLYVFCGVAYWYGQHNAVAADVFLCRNSPRREVVLRVYGSTAITAPIVNTTNVSPDFCFIKMEGESNIFTLTNIGKLTPLPIKPQPQSTQDTNQTKPNAPMIPTNQIRANQTGKGTNSTH